MLTEDITELTKLMRVLNFDGVREFLREHPDLINQQYNVYQLGTHFTTIESHQAGGWTPLGYAAAGLRNMDLVRVLLEFNPELDQEISPFEGAVDIPELEFDSDQDQEIGSFDETEEIPIGVSVRNFILQLEGGDVAIEQITANCYTSHSSSVVMPSEQNSSFPSAVTASYNQSNDVTNSFDSTSDVNLLGRMAADTNS